MAINAVNSFFPSQVVSDQEKVSQDYGLQVGRAIQNEWFSSNSGSTRFRSNQTTFHNLRLYARGEQPVQKYKDELSINGDLSYLNLDWKPVPILWHKQKNCLYGIYYKRQANRRAKQLCSRKFWY